MSNSNSCPDEHNCAIEDNRKFEQLDHATQQKARTSDISAEAKFSIGAAFCRLSDVRYSEGLLEKNGELFAVERSSLVAKGNPAGMAIMHGSPNEGTQFPETSREYRRRFEKLSRGLLRGINWEGVWWRVISRWPHFGTASIPYKTSMSICMPRAPSQSN